MTQLIGISDKKQLGRLLKSLTPETVPLWGAMKPQQMIEHLIVNVEYTNGKKVFICERPKEDAEKAKLAMIYSNRQIPKNLILEELLPNLIYPDLQTAIEQLMKELDDFEEYFKSPGVTSDHLGFGPMNHDEWIIWHGKHFTHHFEQFGLLSN